MTFQHHQKLYFFDGLIFPGAKAYAFIYVIDQKSILFWICVFTCILTVTKRFCLLPFWWCRPLFTITDQRSLSVAIIPVCVWASIAVWLRACAHIHVLTDIYACRITRTDGTIPWTVKNNLGLRKGDCIGEVTLQCNHAGGESWDEHRQRNAQSRRLDNNYRRWPEAIFLAVPFSAVISRKSVLMSSRPESSCCRHCVLCHGDSIKCEHNAPPPPEMLSGPRLMDYCKRRGRRTYLGSILPISLSLRMDFLGWSRVHVYFFLSVIHLYKILVYSVHEHINTTSMHSLSR